MNNKNKELNKRFRIYIIILIISVLVVTIVFPVLLTSDFSRIKFGEPNEVGDTLSGTIGPFIAVIAAFLTFIAFWEQYRANQLQRNDLKHERFERQFYEMLSLHRKNTDEMQIAGRVFGRNCFVQMFEELKFCFIGLNDCKDNTIKKQDHTQEVAHNFIHFFYNVFYYGIGDISEQNYLDRLIPLEIEILNKFKYGEFGKAIRDYNSKREKERNANIPNEPVTYNYHHGPALVKFNMHYKPLYGHANRLGHYYRHLYHLVRIVLENDILEESAKKEYIRIVRAQLSDYEQLMLYYNIVAWFPEDWHDAVVDYKILKNLPIQLAIIDPKPAEFYKDYLSKNMFELLHNTQSAIS